ncbi:hypothetical protein IMSAGC004_01842 [Bacteroidaceae bacterium]|nr:hypothetical protein IMSAGC004_01842 [Bacteroidaceae bacterium]
MLTLRKSNDSDKEQLINSKQKKVSEKDTFFFCYSAAAAFIYF